MPIQILRQIKRRDLIMLGYKTKEINWIINLVDLLEINHKKILPTYFNLFSFDKQLSTLSKLSINSDKNTPNTDMYADTYADTYAKTIIISIINNDYKFWCKNSIHLNYSTMSKYFYLYGYNKRGNNLLRYNFRGSVSAKLLLEFRTLTEKEIRQRDILKILEHIEYENYFK